MTTATLNTAGISAPQHSALWAAFVRMRDAWTERRIERRNARQLRALDNRMLKDISVARCNIDYRARNPR